jgi:hypothetical protein
VVEAYPLENGTARVDLTMAYARLRKNFERAGFTHAAGTTSVPAGHPRVLAPADAGVRGLRPEHRPDVLEDRGGADVDGHATEDAMRGPPARAAVAPGLTRA